MIRALIVDDETHCRSSLQSLLDAPQMGIQVVRQCASADEALQAIGELQPELVFLDVEMPGKSGFDLLDSFSDIPFSIVFTTAYEHYALRAIRSSALDFLLKPVAEEDLKATLKRFEIRRSREHTLRQVEVLLQNYGPVSNTLKKIVVPTNSGLEFLQVDHIVRLEADSNYTTFFFKDGSKLLVAKTLKEMEELLPSGLFFRVHYSHLVHVRYIRKFQKQGGLLIMEDGTEVAVSRHRKEDLIKFLKHHG